MNTNLSEPLSKLKIFSFSGIQMRTFHITWVTFFFCFFGWFGIAPLMPVVREDLGLSKNEIGNIVIASVAATIFARLIIGKMCDVWGPRLSYTILLVIGAIPVIFIGLSNSYEAFLLFRLCIGIIGASFVITQFHTSMMFSPNIVGTANAVSAGWGNLGGGVTNLVMPLIFSAIIGLGYAANEAWRIAMVLPGLVLLVLAFVYYKYTKDTPAGNYSEIKNNQNKNSKTKKGSFWSAALDYRTWLLFLAYSACFGIEITFDNVAAIYFVDNFDASLVLGGALASIFGIMNIFARALGGIVSDKVGRKFGLRGKGLLLGSLLALEGLGIALFAITEQLILAVLSMLLFALFLKMANGATYSIVPFVKKDAIGSVSGIVGAGGNLGAVLAGFLFKVDSLTYSDAFFYLGIAVFVIGILNILIRYERREKEDIVPADTEFEPAS
ncbi:MAG: NarK family nitrate/nitrite MFS transporter [Ignavibacteriaceae bacterium]